MKPYPGHPEAALTAQVAGQEICMETKVLIAGVREQSLARAHHATEAAGWLSSLSLAFSPDLQRPLLSQEWD